jgi:hypothetical protein
MNPDRDKLTVVCRDGFDASQTGIPQRRYPRYFIVDSAGRTIAPGGEGYRHRAVAEEALNAIEANRVA